MNYVYKQLQEQDGVSLDEVTSERGNSWFEVFDAHYRVVLSLDDGMLNCGIDAAWSDERPGKLASYSEYTPAYCDKIEIDETGLLLLERRLPSACNVDMRQSFRVQLTCAYVELVRKAVQLLMARKATEQSHTPARSARSK